MRSFKHVLCQVIVKERVNDCEEEGERQNE